MDYRQLTGQFEMDQQTEIAIEVDRQHLCSPARAGDGVPDEQRWVGDLRIAKELGKPQVDGRNRAARELAFDDTPVLFRPQEVRARSDSMKTWSVTICDCARFADLAHPARRGRCHPDTLFVVAGRLCDARKDIPNRLLRLPIPHFGNYHRTQQGIRGGMFDQPLSGIQPNGQPASVGTPNEPVGRTGIFSHQPLPHHIDPATLIAPSGHQPDQRAPPGNGLGSKERTLSDCAGSHELFPKVK